MPMIHRILCGSLFAFTALTAAAQSPPEKKEVPLPSSKKLLLPVPGGPQRTNSFPTAIASSPDGKYLAILNNGRGTVESKFQQSIALLDLTSNQVRDFPDSRLAINARQTYFLGLAWSSDGTELYASMASLTDPEGRSEEHTSELQSRENLVCRLLLEKKKTKPSTTLISNKYTRTCSNP